MQSYIIPDNCWKAIIIWIHSLFYGKEGEIHTENSIEGERKEACDSWKFVSRK